LGLGGDKRSRENEEDQSIEDDSLYLFPGETQSSQPTSPGLLGKLTPTNIMPLFGNSRVLQARTPGAPKKRVRYLARIKNRNYGNELKSTELEPLTPSKSSFFFKDASSPTSAMPQPRQLRMSPALSPQDSKSSTGNSTRRRRR